MYHTKKDIAKQIDTKDTRDCFLYALFLLMKKKPFSEITITELCKKANFSRKTFYDNFAKKEDLLKHLAEDIALGFHYTDDRSGFLHIFEYLYELREWISLLIENNLWDSVIADVTALLLPLIQNRDWHAILENYDNMLPYYFEFINAGLLRLIYLWYQEDFKSEPAKLAGLVSQILNTNITDVSPVLPIE